MASFVYTGLQLCFITFMTVHLTSKAGFDLIQAGQALAAYQIAGVISRPIWGWLADKVLAARWLLALQGIIMCATAVLAGQFGMDWPRLLVLAICAVAGATASGFTGIAYAEWARLGGARRTEATGLGTGIMFAGVMLVPSAFSVAVTTFGDYAAAYAVVGGLAGTIGIDAAGWWAGNADLAESNHNRAASIWPHAGSSCLCRKVPLKQRDGFRGLEFHKNPIRIN